MLSRASLGPLEMRLGWRKKKINLGTCWKRRGIFYGIVAFSGTRSSGIGIGVRICGHGLSGLASLLTIGGKQKFRSKGEGTIDGGVGTMAFQDSSVDGTASGVNSHGIDTSHKS